MKYEITLTAEMRMRLQHTKILTVDIPEEDNWTNVTDKLPDKMGHYFCFRPDSNFDPRRVQMFKPHSGFDGVYEVTHWQPLPAPPQEQS